MTKDDPQTVIAHHIARLNKAWAVVPDVRRSIGDMIEDATTPEAGNGGGSGVSRPTEAAAVRIEGLQAKDRAILAAIRSVGKAIDHLELECARGLGRHVADTSTEPRCGVMVHRVTNPRAGRMGEVLTRCGQLTDAKVDELGNAIGWDPDGLCAQHRAEVDARAEDERRATEADARRKRRHAIA